MAEIETQSNTQPSQAEGQSIREQAVFKREQEAVSEEEADALFEARDTTELIETTEQPQEVTVTVAAPNTGPLNQWDILLLGAFVGASLLYGFSRGKKGAAVMTVSIYMALAVTQALPDFILNVTLGGAAAFQVSAFIGIFAFLFYWLSRSALLRTFSGEGGGSMIQTLALSILHAGLLLSVALLFIPPQYVELFSPYLLGLFIGEWQLFGWVAAPIVAMIVLGRKE
jgi:hypothetical protein